MPTLASQSWIPNRLVLNGTGVAAVRVLRRCSLLVVVLAENVLHAFGCPQSFGLLELTNVRTILALAGPVAHHL